MDEQDCELIDGVARGRIWKVGRGVKYLDVPVQCANPACPDSWHALRYVRVHDTAGGVAIFSCDPDWTAEAVF